MSAWIIPIRLEPVECHIHADRRLAFQVLTAFGAKQEDGGASRVLADEGHRKLVEFVTPIPSARHGNSSDHRHLLSERLEQQNGLWRPWQIQTRFRPLVGQPKSIRGGPEGAPHRWRDDVVVDLRDTAVVTKDLLSRL